MNTREMIEIGITNTRGLLETAKHPHIVRRAKTLHNEYCALRFFEPKCNPSVKGKILHELIERELSLFHDNSHVESVMEFIHNTL